MIDPELKEEVTDGVFSFRGLPLEPFSFDRQVAAQRLRDDSGAENDVLMIVLCLTPIEEVRRIRGAVACEKFLQRCAEFADKHGITIHPENLGRNEVSVIARRIYDDLAATDFTPELEGKSSPSPNAIG